MRIFEQNYSTNNFRVLHWYGSAVDADLTPGFDINIIKNRILIIKRVAFFFYAPTGGIKDSYVTQGANEYYSNLPVDCRLDKVHDVYNSGLQPVIRINNTPLPMFSAGDSFQLPIDLDIDNLMIKTPAKVQSIQVHVNEISIFADLKASTTASPKVKVIMEVYIDDAT